MRKLEIILVACGLTAIEALLIISCGGIFSPLTLASLVPFLAGATGIILAARRHRASVETAEIVQAPQTPAIEIPAAIKTSAINLSAIKLSAINPSVNEMDWIAVAAAAPCVTPPDPRIYENALPALFKSITDYLTRTSDPMSETLVKIKTVISEYLSSVNRIKDSFERKDYATDLHGGVIQLRTRISEMTGTTSKSFAEISGEIELLSE